MRKIRKNEEKMTDDVERVKSDLENQARLAEDRLYQIKYLQADFDNYRKWAEKEKASIIVQANENLIKDLLVILDDFEKALPSLEQEQNREGMKRVQEKMIKILQNYGLQPIDCVGKKFNPHFHEVICKENREGDHGIILEDIIKGYQLKSKILRPAKVKIAEPAGENKK
jgi:molecular chaperone GrpE